MNVSPVSIKLTTVKQMAMRGPGTPIGVLPQFTTHGQPFTLKIKEKLLLFGRGGFSVTCLDGKKSWRPIRRCSALRVINTLDERGAETLVVKCKLTNMRGNFVLFAVDYPLVCSRSLTEFANKGAFCRGQPKKLFEVFKRLMFVKATTTVSLMNLDGRSMELKVKGGYFDRNATIVSGVTLYSPDILSRRGT
ncbi:hypothetical protein BDM02DRAFT_1771673 [Thelephora ganbajun]|uniref:Uncharacterized protein n=1 Tax=Thelephora ganbajun TaxID=370292 RepID=A0ACB6ZJP9_THEGA|nr:hypothetical protein BDM02DRAFT_1771673 [Thelephora ganbajun]